MNFFSNKIKVVTHDGNFHADEVFACATLSLWAQKMGHKLEIIRSRDAGVVAKADIVVDVGMEYDLKRGRFDHHQKGGAGTHENGISYASFGLIWKHYGKVVCGNEEVFKTIEQKLVSPIDAHDNGINITKSLIENLTDYRINKEMVYAFRSSWKDPANKIDTNFFDFLSIAKNIIEREIKNLRDLIEGESIVKKEVEIQAEPEILVLSQDLPWEQVVAKTKKVKIVVYPEPPSGSWCLENVRKNLDDFESAGIFFPEVWRGLSDDDLVRACGVPGAVFCHRAGFFAVHQTKEGAIEMAKIALQNSKN